MVIHNATFMVEPQNEGALISWLRTGIGEMGRTQAPRLTAMREAGGLESSQADAQSVAFQCEFDTMEEALRWREEHFLPVADRFMAEFGPNAMVFTSIFENISI